jgi:AcrR family transcriptional regulator
MGWGGKVEEQQRAREMRASGMTMPDIAVALGVSKGSVSLWTRDVPVPPMVRRRTRSHTEHPAKVRAREEVAELDLLGLARLSDLNDQAFLAAGAALYAGEGTKATGGVGFANTNPDIATFFMAWLRRFFAVDEARLRASLYLHRGLDLEAASAFWSGALAIPLSQFNQPQIVDREAQVKTSKHENGCITIRYHCTRTQRDVMGLVRALLSSKDLRG